MEGSRARPAAPTPLRPGAHGLCRPPVPPACRREGPRSCTGPVRAPHTPASVPARHASPASAPAHQVCARLRPTSRPPPPRALHSRGGRGFFMPGAHWVRLALHAGHGGPAAAPLCGCLPPTPRLPLSSVGAPGSRGGEVLPLRASPGALRASRRHTCLPLPAGGVYRAGQRHLCLCPAPSLRPGHGRCSRE